MSSTFKSLAKKKYPEISARLKKLDSYMNMILDIPLTLEDACIFLKLSRSYLYKLCERKLIPHHRTIGRLIYFRRNKLDEWINKKSKIRNRSL